jgi:hypothetical protein
MDANPAPLLACRSGGAVEGGACAAIVGLAGEGLQRRLLLVRHLRNPCSLLVPGSPAPVGVMAQSFWKDDLTNDFYLDKNLEFIK